MRLEGEDERESNVEAPAGVLNDTIEEEELHAGDSVCVLTVEEDDECECDVEAPEGVLNNPIEEETLKAGDSV
tara:strand:- start:1463 stop:1681 length:219 start_codon:yes stop_codon:yes gene_type:complete